jgi:hypothetical protein
VYENVGDLDSITPQIRIHLVEVNRYFMQALLIVSLYVEVIVKAESKLRVRQHNAKRQLMSIRVLHKLPFVKSFIQLIVTIGLMLIFRQRSRNDK